MEDLCRLDPSVSSSSPSCLDDMLSRVGAGSSFSLGNYTATTREFHSSSVAGHSMLYNPHQLVTGASSDVSDLIKIQIANHPRYPNLLSAYIECQKVGAPPEMTSILEEIGRENYTTTRSSSEIGADPELDDFMESYCEILQRYKEELSKPFDEAKTFLNNIESQLSNLCEGALTRTLHNHDRSDEVGGTSEEEPSNGEGEAPECKESFVAPQGDEEVKGMLMRKYSGYLSGLKKEFLKRRKKGKLPKNARMTLMAWWNNHYRWPYPTEEEKVKLSEETGLDQKQINNWFINQRKRHWKPSEDMRFALLEGVSVTGNNIEEPMFFDIGDAARINSTSYLK